MSTEWTNGFEHQLDKELFMDCAAGFHRKLAFAFALTGKKWAQGWAAGCSIKLGNHGHVIKIP